MEISSKENRTKTNKENEAVNQLENLINNLENLSYDEIKAQLQVFAKSHKKLLQEVKLLTSVGDRLQKKIKSANEMLQEQAEEIKKINKDLQDKNIELQFTIDELTKARAGKRATTIILIFAIVLFIITEILESTFESFFTGANMLIIYAFKVSLALGFKPIEGFLENAIIAHEMKLQRLEHEQQQKLLEQQEKTKIIDIPKIEIKNSLEYNKETQNVKQNNSSSEMTPEDAAKLERKLKREAMKKMGENRE
jgi:hypothetical protein